MNTSVSTAIASQFHAVYMTVQQMLSAVKEYVLNQIRNVLRKILVKESKKSVFMENVLINVKYLEFGSASITSNAQTACYVKADAANIVQHVKPSEIATLKMPMKSVLMVNVGTSVKSKIYVPVNMILTVLMAITAIAMVLVLQNPNVNTLMSAMKECYV